MDKGTHCCNVLGTVHEYYTGAMRLQKMTSIIITHRITTAKEADKIIVLENGKVAEIGTHEQLSKKEGLYKSLWDIQGALEEEFLKMVDKEVEN